MMKYLPLIAAYGGSVLLASCATTPADPPKPAVVSLEGKDCFDMVDFDAAVSLTPEKPKRESFVTVPVTSETPCLTGDAAGNYVVFKIPDHASNHVIIVGGTNEKIRTLAPTVSLLTEDGTLSRGFEPEQYAFFGNSFGVQIRPRDNEAYILVVTRHDLVGQELASVEQRLFGSTGYVASPAGGYGSTYNIVSGAERKVVRTFSHEGTIRVTVRALTGKIGQPKDG